MDITQLAARLRQLAAWYDPETKEQPTFPFGVHKFTRDAAARLLSLDAHLNASQRALAIARGERLSTVATINEHTLDMFVANNRLPTTPEEAKAYLRDFEMIVTGVVLL